MSPAIDACNGNPGTIPDLLGTLRPQYRPGQDPAESFDMGTFERVPSPDIFADDFEPAT